MGVDLRGSDERPLSDVDPQEIRLDDGSPGYYVFLQNPTALYVDSHEVQEAKNDFSRAVKDNPDAVRKWQGKTRKDIRQLLDLDDLDRAA